MFINNRNWVLNGSIIFETALAIFMCYTPGLNTVLRTAPVIGQVWLTAIPFLLYILAFEEIRKYIIRKYPNSYLGKELLA
jgi:sodium/potassium-transporting ATPase subunit alpha